MNTFAKMGNNVSLHKVFIDLSITLARNYSFHELDLDWEYSQTVVDMNNMGQLFFEWRSTIQVKAQVMSNDPLLIAVAIYFSHKFLAWVR